MTANDTQLVISFDELADRKADFEAPVKSRVFFSDAQTDEFEFVNPIAADELKELRWYIERSWQYRHKAEEGRIEKVETSLEQIGKDLFNAVFEKSARAMGMYERLMERRKEGQSCSIVIDTKEPRILRLPWELLADEGGYLFSRNPPVNIRRRMQKTRDTDMRDFSLPVRVLMVISRPTKAEFIDPRSSAEPLLDALDELGDAVEVEFLRPPTVAALMRRIRDREQPSVHVVHFDGHGVYDPGIGLGFLLFEKDDYSNDLADSSRLGSLLNESGIPLMVLDACQSAEPDDRNPFGSVAAKLIESGVGGVVAMNYSVLVETSRRLIGQFYKALAKGESVSTALGTARLELLADTGRHHYFNHEEQKEVEIELHDWFVPALYQQADELIPFKPNGKTISVTRKAKLPLQEKSQRGGFPPPPLHGFHGRARELLDLERAFATRSILVLHGFGGQGKTSLAAQAAEWFTRTRLFERAAFLSFEHGASLERVLNELGNALVEDNFQIYQGDKIEAIAQSLRETPALVIFDNFESVLPNGNAPLPADELQKLLDAAARWFPAGLDTAAEVEWTKSVSRPRRLLDQRRSCMLITTRNPNIPNPAFSPSKNCLHKELEGLAPSDALELAASILEAYSLPRPPRLPLEALLDFLKGHPLSLQLALPQLRDYSAEQLVAEYQTILPQMKKGEARERNDSLEVSLRFSLDRLGGEAKTLLSRLSVFEGGAMEDIMLAITEIPEDEWNAIKPQLVSTALIRVEELEGVTIPFIHFHPTLIPYLRALSPLPELGEGAGGEGTEPDIHNTTYRYWRGYYEYASQLYRDDRQHPIQARSIVLRELPNLKRALHLALEAGALDEAVTFADSINKFLNNFGRWRERDEVAAEVDRYTGTQVNRDGKLTKREYLLESGRGERLLQQGRAGEAEKVFRALLSRLEVGTAYDKQESLFDQTTTLARLGRCLGAQGRPSQAADFYRRAIALAEGLEQTKEILNHIGKIHTDLADVYASGGMYADAKKEYETSIEFCKQADDDRAVGVNLGQLGTLAMTQGDLNEARKRHLEALSLFQRMGEDQMEAVAWHQLGMVAQEQAERVGAQGAAPYWDEAERCYKQSITINEGLGNFSQAAATCNQLALVAENAGRPAEAERWYLRAIEIHEKMGRQQELAAMLSNLANLYLSQHRLDEAETYARRALAIDETLDHGAIEIWKDYALQAQLAEKRGRMDEVRAWRRKEQESFAAFAGSDHRIQQWQQEIAVIVAACQGNEEAIEVAKQIVENYINDKDWHNLANAMQQVLNGERGDEIYDGLDREDALVIRRVLQALSGENANPLPPSAPSPKSDEPQSDLGEGRGGGITLPQLLELVERAAGGDKALGGQLFTAFQQMSRAEDPSTSALGKALGLIVLGEKNPDLSSLPDELASAVRGMLGRLRQR
ncbi:MAG: tetratricopeptide repeat protein [Chloroflexota bacterium]